MGTGAMFHIPRDDADEIAQQETPLSQLIPQYAATFVQYRNFVFDDRSDITQADVVPYSECPTDLTFTFVQEPAIYPKS